MNLRVIYNICLVRLHIRKVLPTDAVRRVRVNECGESLIAPQADDFVILGSEIPVCGRESVIAKLRDADRYLQQYGCRIGVFEVYRDMETQRRRRDAEYNRIKQEHPEYGEDDVLRMLNARVSNITQNDVGGHQTGGAVDCTLCFADGRQQDMGAGYLEFGAKTKTACRNLTDTQRRNRKLLCKAMKRVGFVNYPNEWWHFSYGDKMWAAYSRRSVAIYGPAALPK